jgi:hypothetical protein
MSCYLLVGIFAGILIKNRKTTIFNAVSKMFVPHRLNIIYILYGNVGTITPDRILAESQSFLPCS